MIKRTIEISREPAHLAVRNRQLLLKREGAIVGSIPCEDIGVVVVDHPQTTYTHGALASLATCDAAVIICGDNHLPIAILLPLASHSQVVTRLNLQLGVSVPLAKQLWKQIVAAKVRAQAENLAAGSALRKKLLALAREVKSGDPSNIEAQAAKLYWQHWLWEEEEEEEEPSPRPLPGRERGKGVSPRFQRTEMGDRPRANGERPLAFRRDADGDGLNHFLNYGYTIVRAAVARAIVAAGLLPSLGVHHKHRGNAFCLADDLMEPLRPLVDDRVREMRRLGYEELNQPAKKELLEVLTQPMQLGEQTGPLMVMLHRMTASLVRCYAGEGRSLEIPTPVVETAGVGAEGRQALRRSTATMIRRKIEAAMLINGYRCMWVLAMFDLPTDTKKARKEYALFRKSLLGDGFTQMQYSVYARHCPSKENAEVHLNRIERHLPPDGEVRVITITDKQFERMQIYWGKMRRPPEVAPCQMELF